ncbi:formiminotetrahydrofolate cyclodeaminase [Flavobacterium sp. 28YEA47A]
MDKKPKKKDDILKPKEDVLIEKDEPKFNSVLSAIVKPKEKDDESSK